MAHCACFMSYYIHASFFFCRGCHVLLKCHYISAHNQLGACIYSLKLFIQSFIFTNGFLLVRVTVDLQPISGKGGNIPLMEFQVIPLFFFGQLRDTNSGTNIFLGMGGNQITQRKPWSSGVNATCCNSMPPIYTNAN